MKFLAKIEFLIKYQNVGSYAHFEPFLKVIILLVSEILRKNGVKSAKTGTSRLMQEGRYHLQHSCINL